MTFDFLKHATDIEGVETATRASQGGDNPQAHVLSVSETYFSTMGIPVLLGRNLSASDAEGAAKVCLVNEAFVHKFLPGTFPIGQTVKVAGASWQLVGVCRDTKYDGLRYDAPPTVYFPFRQRPNNAMYFALRTSLPPMALGAAARKAAAAVDLNVPVTDLGTQEQVRDDTLRPELTFAALCGSLAGLAVLLSCIGLYGLISYDVARRTAEVGVRMALGASRRQVILPVLRKALVLVGAGVAIGLPASIALMRVAATNLYGLTAFDPATYIGATSLLLGVALAAAWMPAVRAAKVDPMVALRCE
jgi:predicted permease